MSSSLTSDTLKIKNKNMELLGQLAQFLKEVFSWWFIVTPWEQVVHIRAGKKVKVLKEGFYFKIPFLDQIYKQEIRLRAVDISMQTVSSKDGEAISVKSVMNYCIKDIYKLYNTISHPEMTLSGIVMSGISEYINNKLNSEISILELEEYITSKLNSVDYGLGDISVKIMSWAKVKTYRLIQDQTWISEGMQMSSIK